MFSLRVEQRQTDKSGCSAQMLRREAATALAAQAWRLHRALGCRWCHCKTSSTSPTSTPEEAGRQAHRLSTAAARARLRPIRWRHGGDDSRQLGAAGPVQRKQHGTRCARGNQRGQQIQAGWPRQNDGARARRRDEVRQRAAASGSAQAVEHRDKLGSEGSSSPECHQYRTEPRDGPPQHGCDVPEIATGHRQQPCASSAGTHDHLPAAEQSP